VQAGRNWAETIGVGHIVLAALLIVYPAIGSNFFLTQIGAYSLILGMISLSLMLLAGYGGMVSLAQISVAGIAGYSVAVFGLNNSGVHGFGWPFWVVVPFATLIAAVASALIGWISVRTEGIYTIMITLAIATAFYYFVQQNYSLFNGFPGFTGIRAPEFWGVTWRDPALLPAPCLRGIA
jgi:branched-chain amino acid transport system permease protein